MQSITFLLFITFNSDLKHIWPQGFQIKDCGPLLYNNERPIVPLQGSHPVNLRVTKHSNWKGP